MSKSSVSCCASSDWSYDRLVRDPLKAMFIGLRAQFRAETRTLTREVEFWGCLPIAGTSRHRPGSGAPGYRAAPGREWGAHLGGSAPHGSPPAVNHRPQHRVRVPGIGDHRRPRAAATASDQWPRLKQGVCRRTDDRG